MTQQAHGTSTLLAAYALQDHAFPALARTRALDAITDCVGCMLAGSREPLAGKVARIAAMAVPNGARSLMLGTAADAAPADAALYNGAIANVLDYDDSSYPAYAHTSAVLVPALLAVAASGEACGADIVTAYIVGVEVFGKLGRALNTAHYQQGWHATSTFGTLAAAVAAGRLLRLTQAQLVMALGIAASSAGGLRANFGTEMKPLHAGFAARNGVLAALLARAGFEASADALDHRFGYVQTFNHREGIDPAPLAAWGEPLEILSANGIGLKAYPSCGATHTAIEAALALRDQIGDAPIAQVRVGVSEFAFSPLAYAVPQTPLQGKFSMHFCVAAALVDGVIKLSSFSQDKIADPRIQALMPKVRMEVDDRVRHDPAFASVVEITTASGKSYEQLVPVALGKPARWFTRQQSRDKFFDCGAAVFAPERLERIFALLQSFDRNVAAHELFAALRCAG